MSLTVPAAVRGEMFRPDATAEYAEFTSPRAQALNQPIEGRGDGTGAGLRATDW